MTSPDLHAAVHADGDLVEFARSIVDAARRQFGAGVVTEPGLPFSPLLLYTETHYALAAVLLGLHAPADDAMFDVAEGRLRLWDAGNGPMTFFNAMAVCLTRIVLDEAGRRHPGLDGIIERLLARTTEHRHVAYRQFCGNNAYLQQVAVDKLLLPAARGATIQESAVADVVREFGTYRTPEGLFYDLPREGTAQERLTPPTYVLKMLFLLGVCHHIHPHDAFADLFVSGMSAVLPLLTREGTLSYVGRTDNSPFAAGLTVFNLRIAAQLDPAKRSAYESAALAASRYYETFPRTATGLLQCTRFTGAASDAEHEYARDEYAFVGQYSLSSTAYALLGRYWAPAKLKREPVLESAPTAARSDDLGIVRFAGSTYDLCLRTTSQATSWDRRYLGPTILRYKTNDRLLVGAITHTLSTDLAARKTPATHRLRTLASRFASLFVSGIEQLDASSVGFLPVVRDGRDDYLPYDLASLTMSATRLETTYQFARLRMRGVRACLPELEDLVRKKLPALNRPRFSNPPISQAAGFTLSRTIEVGPAGCRLQDRLEGPLEGKTVLLSVRYVPGTVVRVTGFCSIGQKLAWTSDGRQTLEIYEAHPHGRELQYSCVLEPR